MSEKPVIADKVTQLVKESEQGEVPEVLPILGLDNFVVFSLHDCSPDRYRRDIQEVS